MVWLKNRKIKQKANPETGPSIYIYIHLINNKGSISKQEGHSKWLKGAATNE